MVLGLIKIGDFIGNSSIISHSIVGQQPTTLHLWPSSTIVTDHDALVAVDFVQVPAELTEE